MSELLIGSIHRFFYDDKLNQNMHKSTTRNSGGHLQSVNIPPTKINLFFWKKKKIKKKKKKRGYYAYSLRVGWISHLLNPPNSKGSMLNKMPSHYNTQNGVGFFLFTIKLVCLMLLQWVKLMSEGPSQNVRPTPHTPLLPWGFYTTHKHFLGTLYSIPFWVGNAKGKIVRIKWVGKII
jgi:hypothetical protein